LTLRRKILLALVLVAGAGFVATDIALYLGVQSYLYGQINSELLALSKSTRTINSACTSSSITGIGPGGGGPTTPGLPENTWVGFVADGQVLCHAFLSPALDGTTPEPHVPTAFGGGNGATAYQTYFGTSSSGTGGTSYQMFGIPSTALVNQVTPVSGTLIVAIPSTSADATINQIFEIELIATIAVILVLAAVTWTLVVLSLRPLEDMTRTADAIAAGDLSQRVPARGARGTRTEVGRLGAALNTMLAQIETAFAAREQSETRLRRFVADASHELRTPLTSIRGYAELFRRGAANRPDDLANSMRRIEEESVRMGVLVENMLQLARLDVGASETSESELAETTSVDLATLATDAVSDQRASDATHPVTLRPSPAAVDGDEGALRQVIANLLANAVHHTPAGTAVSVTTGTDPRAGTAYVEVADAGPGMSEEQAAHAFERFWRADPARTRGHAGAGLGLSIVAAIASAHRGSVTLETAAGQGCRFRVVLPSADIARPGLARAPSPPAAGALPTAQPALPALPALPAPEPPTRGEGEPAQGAPVGYAG
jgi:two-component system, OmpR family, sensor kinase